jgi:glycosyltransferase involved in cell wall biosynthesis
MHHALRRKARQVDAVINELDAARRRERRKMVAIRARARHEPLAGGELLAEYRKADLFALACRIARDGDRDGLPNVLAEAQSQGLACVATRVSAIPELIRDDTGVLVSEADTVAFAAALQALITDPARRRELGDAGQARLRAEFSLEANFERLALKFGLAAHEARVLRTA